MEGYANVQYSEERILELLFVIKLSLLILVLTGIAPNDPKSTSKSDSLWVNVNAFAALQTAKSGNVDAFDSSLSGLWTLREGLETPEPAKDAAIQAAGMWIVHAGELVRRHCKEGKSFDGRMGIGGGDFKSKQWTGYNLDRWSVWQKALAEAKESRDSDTRQIAADALERMEKIE